MNTGPADWTLTVRHHDEYLDAVAREAITRVTALHAFCDCTVCGLGRRYCVSCHEVWPCPTIQAVRGITARPTTEPTV